MQLLFFGGVWVFSQTHCSTCFEGQNISCSYHSSWTSRQLSPPYVTGWIRLQRVAEHQVYLNKHEQPNVSDAL